MARPAKLPEPWKEAMRRVHEMETKGSLSCDGRVDPWECYQDTWQTTCSVLEHHRDLMKVSWARAKGGWMSWMQERGGGGGFWPAGLLPWYLLPDSLPVVR